VAPRWTRQSAGRSFPPGRTTRTARRFPTNDAHRTSGFTSAFHPRDRPRALNHKVRWRQRWERLHSTPRNKWAPRFGTFRGPMLNAETALTQIRWTRSEPPGKAANDEGRRALYCASLQQFEELLTAAEAAGHASRPLPLFYALSQAGRAIVAAYGDAPVCAGHGLGEVRPSNGETALLHRRIERRATQRDTFGAVARATQSGDFQWRDRTGCGLGCQSAWPPTSPSALEIGLETCLDGRRGGFPRPRRDRPP